MRTSKALSHAVAVAFGVAMLAGCGSQMASTPITPAGITLLGSGQVLQNGRLNQIPALRGIASGQRATTRSFFNPDAKGKGLIFVSNALGSTGQQIVNIYLQRRKNKMVGEITNLYGAGGLATDATANLYIAEQNGANSKVVVYAPPYTGAAALTLDDTGWLANDVAVSTKGIVGVANLFSSTSYGNGSVTLYAKNSTTPCATITSPNVSVVSNVGFDDKGNLYIDGFGTSPSYAAIVGEIKGGCQATKITLLTTTNSFGEFLAGVKVDKADHITILDESNNVIDTYDPPKKGSLGAPVSTTPLMAGTSANAFAFRASGSDVYTVGGTSSVSQVLEYDYPVGGTAEKALNLPGSFWEGIAVTPSLLR